VSGLNWYEKPHELPNLARDGMIELAISDAILDEFSRILHDTLEWSDDRLNIMRAGSQRSPSASPLLQRT
jgi:hypothetical protein